MGQRLLLAISLLIAARIVTFISPLPAEPNAGHEAHQKHDAVSGSVSPVADVPSVSMPQPMGNSSEGNSSERTDGKPAERASLPLESTGLSDRNDFNPVQDGEVAPSTMTSDARVPAAVAAAPHAMTTVCATLKSAVVTVRAGREIGSGSIVDSRGWVITNYHVVRRLRDQSLFVTMQTGTEYAGQVIASDRSNDLALIQLQTQQPLSSIRLAATSRPMVGQPVCAIGSPFGQPGKITTGQLVRVLSNGDLQSDVELQPGNSGGPLINAQGEMIGVNKGVARDRRQVMEDSGSSPTNSRRISYATSSAVVDNFIQQNRGSNVKWDIRPETGVLF